MERRQIDKKINKEKRKVDNSKYLWNKKGSLEIKLNEYYGPKYVYIKTV